MRYYSCTPTSKTMSRIEILLVSLISLGLLSYASHAAPMEDAKELDRLPEDVKKLQNASILQINNATFLNAAPMEDDKEQDKPAEDNKIQNASIAQINNATFLNAAPIEDAKRKDKLREDNKFQNASIVVNNATFVNGSGTRSRRSIVTPLWNQYYKIIHRPDNGVLDSNAHGNIYLLNWNGGSYQQWKFQKITIGCCNVFYKIINKATGKVVDGNGHDAYTHSSNGGTYQQWIMIPVAGDWFKLEQRATGHVLDGGTVSHGGPVYMLPYNGGNFQQWRLEAVY